MAVVYTKYRSVDRTSANYLILSNLTLKNKLYYKGVKRLYRRFKGTI